MKLEYLSDISDGGRYQKVITEQLVRLYDFDSKEAGLFHQAIKSNLVEKPETLNLNDLGFIECLNCSLVLMIAESNKGIEKAGGNNFVCKLTKKGYEEILHLTEPFLSSSQSGYQWLYDTDNEIDFLFSPGGTW